MIDYKDSGVDIDAGNRLVENIKPLVKRTFDSNVIGGIGSFAGAYALPSGYKEPVILSATDGVGTKLKLAIESKRLDTVGIDLVAMCVNDLICNFAKPMFFLDYYATGKLDVDSATKIIEGISVGCIEAECSLIGGESAEMPGMYRGDDFDLAGFAVGIAERSDIEKSYDLKSGDVIVALPSSGFHSNGYSLIRKLFFEKMGMKFEDKIESRELIDLLLEPTKIYVKDFSKTRSKIKALAHITGGGLVENIPRILSQSHDAYIQKSAIRTRELFEMLREHVKESELYRTFNMGVGMVFVCDAKNGDDLASECGGYIIGEIRDGSGKTILD